jgi:metallo-beta-lactamase family protein
MLRDRAHIQESEVEWKNRKAKRSGGQEIEPLYSMKDAYDVIQKFRGIPYHETFDVVEGIRARFVDAGHLLGSASIEVWLTEGAETRKVVFSGDIGNANRPLIKDPEYIEDADYVLEESTYGNREHGPDHGVPKDFAQKLAEEIERTLKGGGNVVIPAFSVGRTQEILYYIRKIKEDHMLPDMHNFPVYMDSPLAVEATNIFNENVKECFDEEALEMVNSGINPIGFSGLRIAVTPDESKAINMNDEPKVIISASGMCEAGRIRHHLKHNLWRKESTILFVGYQVPGTLGFNLLHGAKTVRLFQEDIAVNATIRELPGISGHADKNQLLAWIKAFKKPRMVFIVHGDDEVCDFYAKDVNDEAGFPAYAPYSGDAFDLITGQQIAYGSREKVQKKNVSHGGHSATAIYERLLGAGQRLIEVIRKNQGLANKDMAKFADQVNNLCDKWDR